MRPVVLAVLLVLLAAPATAERRVYAGDELEALVCAQVFAHSATWLAQQGAISPAERDSILTWSILVMERYTTGTPQQKVRAIRAVGARRTALGAVDDFRRRAKACLRRFPLRDAP